MGLSHHKAGTAALAAAAGLGFATLASAQGFYYEDLSTYCPTQYNHRYLGCFATTKNPFPWTPVNQDLTPTGDLSKSYIEWVSSTNWNTTITPTFCSEVCRAHGHKYAALWNSECSCGSSLDYTNQAGAAVTLSDKIVPEGQCSAADGCPGDRLEACGTAAAARIFVDPSFEGTAAENNLPVLTAGYEYLGCFQDPNFPTSEDTITAPDQKFGSPAACFSYCADLGKPLVFMSANTGDGGTVNCFCGQDFGVKAQELTPPPDGSCSRSCSDTNILSCSDPDCCGTANGPFPVYANPALMGCYVPRIPGRSDPAAVTPAWDSYQCFETPSNIANRVVASAADYSGVTISRTATFVATASPFVDQDAWVLYGCYGQDSVSQALTGFVAAPGAAFAGVGLTPNSCALYCGSQTTTYNYAAIAGIGVGQTCYCATGLGGAGTGSVGPTMIQDCNRPCTGDDEQMCGGNGGPLVYARGAFADGGPYAQGSVSYAQTPVYSCTPTSGSTSSSASSTTSSTASDSLSSTASESFSSTASESFSSTTASTSSVPSSDSTTSSFATTTSSTVSETSTSSDGGSSDSSSTTSSTASSDTASTTSSGSTSSDTATSSSPGSSGTVSSTESTSSSGTSSTSSGTSSETRSSTTISSTGSSDSTSASSTSSSETTSATETVTSSSTIASGTTSSESESSTGSSATESSVTSSSSTTATTTTASSGTSSSATESVTSSSATESVTSSSGTATSSTTSFSGTASITSSSATASVTSFPSLTISSTPGFFNTSSATGSFTSSGTASGNFSATASSSATATASSNGTSSGSGPSGTSSSTTASGTAPPVPGETTVVGEIFLAVFLTSIAPNATTLTKRQGGAGFVGGAGPVNPTSCTDATVFTLVDGVLGVGGEAISTDPGVAFMAFAVGDGSISVTFTVVDGVLYWYNAAFVGGVAGFCQVPASGQVYATFSTPDVVPLGCVPVQLVVIAESECDDGEIISILPTNSASATSPPPTSVATSVPTGVPTGVPSEEDIYALDASPAGELCVTVTESWVPGQPTFIHEEL
ncbi:hypothetical protein SLS62_007629 [Diatrype stigma]|uniref:WSC domain-containing protein n=1 Tax=Diatrype stigma TaxID=117547 RepID=A0AAN9YQK2_9PEZI